MPLVPNGAGSPYPTIGDIQNTARQRVNDMQNDVNGDLLTNDSPYMQTCLTDAWTWLQDMCADNGVECNTDEFTLYGLPASVTQDVSQQAFVSWQGCSDGVNQYPQPVLRQDMIVPLSVWRRQSNGAPVGVGNAAGDFLLMRQAEDGLPRWLNYDVYDWRANALYYYANTYSQDLLIRGSFYFADLNALQPSYAVPIRGCKEALGSRVAFYFANARVPGGAGATKLEQLSMDAFNASLAQRTSKRKQRMTVRRQGYGNRGYGNPWPVIRSF